jgi:hypothetical protein
MPWPGAEPVERGERRRFERSNGGGFELVLKREWRGGRLFRGSEVRAGLEGWTLQGERCRRESRGGREVEVASVAVWSAAAETALVGIADHEDTQGRPGLGSGYRHTVEAEVAEEAFGYTAVQEVGTAYLDIDGE